MPPAFNDELTGFAYLISALILLDYLCRALSEVFSAGQFYLIVRAILSAAS